MSCNAEPWIATSHLCIFSASLHICPVTTGDAVPVPTACHFTTTYFTPACLPSIPTTNSLMMGDAVPEPSREGASFSCITVARAASFKRAAPLRCPHCPRMCRCWREAAHLRMAWGRRAQQSGAEQSQQEPQ